MRRGQTSAAKSGAMTFHSAQPPTATEAAASPSPQPCPPSTSPWTLARRILAGVCVLSALGLWLAQGDYVALAAIGYLPIIAVRLITGHAEGMTVSELWSWTVIKSLLVALGGLGLLWAGSSIWPERRLFGRLSDLRLRRASVALVAVAVTVPVGYAVTRLAWALGIPLGVTRKFLAEIGPIVYNGLGLALMALGGAVLTIGLLRPWGEVFPRWLPVIGRRRVPIALAVNWALAVSVLVMVAGLFFVRAVIAESGLVGAPTGADQQIAAWLPEMFWPMWSVALAGAALTYRERRVRSEGPGCVRER